MRAAGLVHGLYQEIFLMKLRRVYMLLFLFAGASFCPRAVAQLEAHLYTYSIDNFPDVYGGREEWKRFLRHHMIYPRAELKQKQGGTVKIYFVVTKDGRAARAKVTKHVSPAIDREALRLLSLLEWMPAHQRDSAVNAEHSVEITFSPAKYRKWVKERGYAVAAFTDLPPDTSFTVYKSADKAPAFADPEKTFVQFITANIEYPEVAKRKGIEGNVALSFVVEPDGRTSNIRIETGVGGGCNEEATRVIGLTKWQPAQKDSKYVRYRMKATVSFKLINSFKDNSSGSQRAMWGQ